MLGAKFKCIVYLPTRLVKLNRGAVYVRIAEATEFNGGAVDVGGGIHFDGGAVNVRVGVGSEERIILAVLGTWAATDCTETEGRGRRVNAHGEGVETH
jgi:hypothetical protein